MRDLLMLVLIAAFFAMCIAYVAWCDRIIGPDAAPFAGGGTDAGASDVTESVVHDAMS